ncbi:HAMP domain-containing sensor histidine kinase [Sorangium sp. So ce834]|uniref:sensor histidine kinase n=1 Tax=Sorangium sp. So ce834 TaxID=3133321 RepID=UPI003F61FBBF
MISWDPLGAAEQAAVADEILSVLRHDLRNRFAIVRNASFYIKRKVAGDAAYSADPRIAEFFGIIDEEVIAASARLDESVDAARLFTRRSARVSAADCVRRAAACARIGASGARVELSAEDGDVEADPIELAVAVRCLIENAVESTPEDGVVTVQGAASGARYLIQVTDAGGSTGEVDGEALLRPFYTTKPGHFGLGLNIARRVARRYRGALALEPRSRGTSAIIDLPLAAPPDAGGAGPEPAP